MAMAENDFGRLRELFDEIRTVLSTGIERFNPSSSGKGCDFRDKLTEIKTLVEILEQNQEILTKKCPDYDFVDANDVRIKSNGYRSLLTLLQNFLEYCCSCLKSCLKQKMLSSIGAQLDNIKSLIRPLNSMITVITSAVQMTSNSDSLMDLNYCNLLAVGLTEDMARDVFFGSCLGFQYPNGIKTLLNYLAVVLACYDDWRSSNEYFVKKIFSRLLKTAMLSDEEKGIMIANVTDGAGIQLAKAFWSLPEKKEFQALLKIVNQFISTDICIDLFVPEKTITIKTTNHDTLLMSPPTSANTGSFPIRLLLLSNKWREGQPPPSNYRSVVAAAPSDNIIVHIHGGGFIATSPDSHMSYLRVWSRELDCPVISIDYSLAPEAPYPRGLEDCLFAYVWILNNLKTLGTTGYKIILAGDSAGGNLALATSMKLKILQLRQPNHIFTFYPPMIVKLCVTPSRFMAIFDLVLPLGILVSCLQAYIGEVSDEAVIKKRSQIRNQLYLAKGCLSPKNIQHKDSTNVINNDSSSISYIAQMTNELMATYKDSPITNDPFVSPALATDDMLMGLPPITIVGGSLDPLLDDSIILAKRLKAINHPVTLRVMEGLSHGFLMFHIVEDFKEGNDKSIDLLKEALTD